MKGLTYAELAARYDYGGEWNWRKRVTRSGLRAFLIAVARDRRSRHPVQLTPAETIHADSMFAFRTALHDLGIRLPAKLSANDRARVRAMLAIAPFEVRNSKVGRWAGMR